jgi:isopenicillin N synthase-like dioxygenase
LQHEVGFLTLHNTPIPVSDIAEVLAAYRSFSHYPRRKSRSRHGADWIQPWLGQVAVNRSMQTDYKQIFDSGFEVAGSDCPHMRPINGPMCPLILKR